MQEEELVSKMPQLCSPTDFNLSNIYNNQQFIKKLLKKDHTILEQNTFGTLFMTGDGVNGYIAMHNEQDKTVDYLIKYSSKSKPWIDTTVSQIMLWRVEASVAAVGLTRHVFFEYLLKKWPTIMSDSIQTPDGQRFWGDRLAEAVQRGHRVGLAKMNEQRVEWYNPAEVSFRKWWGEHKTYFYGPSQKFKAFRFVIAP